jgi:ATP-dependent exoDNAse (exonuclease V) beta subunit
VRLTIEGWYGTHMRTLFPDWQEREDDLQGLIGFAARFDDLGDMVAQVTLLNGEASDKSPEPEEDCLRLTTIHQSKGLEFPVVILLGVADGLLPLQRAMDEGDVEEERRLFYVACTRARNHLVFWGMESKESKGSLADLLPDDYYEDRYEPIPEAWLDAPSPRAAERRAQPIGDRDLIQARLVDADRTVTIPSKAGSKDEVADEWDEVTGAGLWRTLDPRDAGNLIHKALEHAGWMQVEWPRIERLVRRQWPHPSVDSQDFESVMAHVRRAVSALASPGPAV